MYHQVPSGSMRFQENVWISAQNGGSVRFCLEERRKNSDNPHIFARNSYITPLLCMFLHKMAAVYDSALNERRKNTIIRILWLGIRTLLRICACFRTKWQQCTILT